MLKHVLSIILNQRKSNFWIFAELLIVAVCLWAIVDYMATVYFVKKIPTGYNIENTYRIDLNERIPGSDNYISPEDKTTTTGEDLLAVMELIRRYPAVESVSLSKASQPYAATSYGQIFFKKLSYNTNGISAQEFRVTPSFFDVFKTQSVDGKDLKQALSAHSIIISSNTATALTGNVAAVGKNVLIDENGLEKQITAEYVPVRMTEYFKAYNSFFTLLSEDEIAKNVNPGNLSQMELCIRVKPDAEYNFIDNFIRDMSAKLMVGNIYLIDVRPVSYIKEFAVAPAKSEIFMRSVLFRFLIINIFLGISGVFNLRTQQRQNELGLRIAVGSPKIKLQLLVITEGLLLLTVAMVPVVILVFNLGLMELVNSEWFPFTLTRFIIGIGGVYVIMAGIILAGVWYPAYKAAKVRPAEVLRDE